MEVTDQSKIPERFRRELELRQQIEESNTELAQLEQASDDEILEQMEKSNIQQIQALQQIRSLREHQSASVELAFQQGQVAQLERQFGELEQ